MTDVSPGALVKWGDFPADGPGLALPTALVLAISVEIDCASIIKILCDGEPSRVMIDAILSDSVCISSDELVHNTEAT